MDSKFINKDLICIYFLSNTYLTWDLHLSWSDRELWFRWLGSLWRKVNSNYMSNIWIVGVSESKNFCSTYFVLKRNRKWNRKLNNKKLNRWRGVPLISCVTGLLTMMSRLSCSTSFMLKLISRQNFQVWELSSFIPRKKTDLKYRQYVWIQNASTKSKYMSYRIPTSDLLFS